MFTDFQLQIVVVLLCIIVLLQIALYTQRARAARRPREDMAPSPSPRRKPAGKPAAAPVTPHAELPMAIARRNNRCRRAAGGAVRIITSAVRRKKQEEPKEEEPPVELILPKDATSGADQTRLLTARHSPGFNPARRLVEQALLRHSGTVRLDSQEHSPVTVRYLVDGVWHAGDTTEFEPAAAAIETLETLAGLGEPDVAATSGEFAAVYNSRPYDATITSRTTNSGRRVVVDFDIPQRPLVSIADIGVTPQIEAELRTVLDEGRGFLLLSAASDSGLRTTTNVLLNRMDRFQRDAVSLEDCHAGYAAVEAVDLKTYCSARGECPADLLPEVFHRDPHVVVVRDLINGRTVDALCGGLEASGRLVIGTVRAGGCVEALLRVLRLGADREAFAQHVTAVLNQRLIRKLCNACKQPYTPKPHVLRELGIADENDVLLYRRPPKSDEACPECGGIGYRGRTGLFELLVVGNRVRRQLAESPQSELLAAAATEDGMQCLREEGSRLVADGVTSVTELARVLKRFPLSEPAAEFTVPV